MNGNITTDMSKKRDQINSEKEFTEGNLTGCEELIFKGNIDERMKIRN